MILNAIPMDLKRAIGIGMRRVHHADRPRERRGVTNQGATPLSLVGELTTWPILVFVVGLGLSAALVARKVKGALLIGILASTVLAIVINELKDETIWANGIAAIPGGITATPDFGWSASFSFDFVSALGTATAFAAVISVMLSDFFDTMGTVIGLGGEAKLLDKDGRLPGINGCSSSTRWRPRRAVRRRRRRTPRTSRARRGSPRAAAPV